MEATQTATATQIQIFLKEFNREAETTRKMLAIVPENNWDYKPHEKSMTLRQLATHVAEIAGWPQWMMVTPGLDFASTPYEPTPINTNAELVKYFEENLTKTNDQLAQSSDEDLLPSWNITNGDQLIAPFTKGEALWQALYQTIHHRAQLGVYLRILNIPIPGSYGPSADEMSKMNF